MKNPFRFLFPSYRRERKRLKTLATIAESVAMIRKFVEKGLVSWQPRHRHYLIEQSIAEPYLTKPDYWFAFMKMLIFYAIDEQCQASRRQAETEARAQAVREAQAALTREGRGAYLTKADIDRIGRNAVDNMPPADLPVIEEFDFAIIRATAPSAAEATEANGQLVVVGHYHIDGKTEMALYDDIKHNLSSNS